MGWLETVKNPEKGVSNSKITKIADAIDRPPRAIVV